MPSSTQQQFSKVRRPAVAGMFYPQDPAELRRMIAGFLEGQTDASDIAPKAYVLPHAGYVYSGPVAGTGYRSLARERGKVERVVLLGPSHRVGFHGLAVSSHDAFATPLGVVPVDRESVERILKMPQVTELDQAHAQEHSLEVHLPFLQMALGEIKLVPIVVGDAEPEEVAEVLDELWGGAETRVVISTDLSHYHDYRSACALDRETVNRIESLQPVASDQACGATPLNGLLRSAKARGMGVRLLDLRNSGDTAGPRDRVVGYAAMAVG